MTMGALPYLVAVRPHEGLLVPSLSARRHGPKECHRDESQEAQIPLNHELLDADSDDQRWPLTGWGNCMNLWGGL